jgi:hypothetical protein
MNLLACKDGYESIPESFRVKREERSYKEKSCSMKRVYK